MKNHRTCFAVACLLWLLMGVAPSCDAAEATDPKNLIENGGFETWAPLDPNFARGDALQNVILIPPNLAPTGWTPMHERVKHQNRTATIAMDEQVKHGGARSVRIENRDMRDITLVMYSTERFARRPDDPRNIRPNRRYLVRWWVKGENVREDGTGPILMMFYMSEKNGKPGRVNTGESGGELPKGSFDWQRRQFVFITDENAKWATMTFQLRWTTGTIWYDDIELLDRGPVTPVKTY